ncbi:MAG: S8 family serine peptidase [Saprospiraceae bacterium]|nr:S8 family serine peptidase [Saprospiraceae bacterium]
MNYRIISTIVLTLICYKLLVISTLDAQQISHRQGEIMVLLHDNAEVQDFIYEQALRKESNQLLGHEKLSIEWNIHLLKFNYSVVDENDILLKLKSNPNVKIAQKNHLLSYRKIPNDTYFNKQWQHLNDGTEGGISGADFRTTKAWDLTTGGVTDEGDSIVVCIIDGGGELSHPDLKKNIWVNKEEIPDNKIDDDKNGFIDDYRGWNADSNTDVLSLNNHGTSIAGIIGAVADNRLGVSGINWNIKMMIVQGGGDEASAVRSYTYPWRMRKEYNLSNGKRGAYVVSTNSSWGRDRGKPEESPIWCAMYDSLGAVGILNIGSTTNLDLDVEAEGDLPTNCESDFLVGVTNLNWNDQKEIRAGYGLKSIDLGAYGESIFTTASPNSFGVFNGTSAAAPQVSGAVGLLYSLPCNSLVALSKSNPAEAALLTKALLMQNVRKLNSLKNYVITSGVMNIWETMNAITPFIVTVNITDIQIEVPGSWIIPAIFQIRKSGTSEWKDYQVPAGQKISIKELEKCTNYEYRLSGGCARYQNGFSNPHTIITEGCCEAPRKIEVIEAGLDNIALAFKGISLNSNFIYYVKEFNTDNVDTFKVENFTDPLFTINGLKRCSRYEIKLASVCEDKISAVSSPLVISTTGCDQCDDVDYCDRDRPTSDFEWLESITLNSEIFHSGQNMGYGNYVGTQIFAPLKKSQTHTIELLPGYSLDSSQLYFAVWIDFNHNSRMEDTENIIPQAYINNNKSVFAFSIPSTSKLGLTRMRAIVKFGENGVAPPVSCFTGIEFGEYEDYCISIVDEQCSAPTSIVEKTKTINSISLSFTKSNQNDIVHYIYRKLPYDLWIEGNEFGSSINLSKLDSCSLYEIRLSNQCSKSVSKELRYNFNTITPECFIATKEMNNTAIKIYPNPSMEIFTVESDQFIRQYKIYNAQGSVAISKNINASRFQIENTLLPGIYWLECTLSNGTRIVKKLMKS